MLLEALNIGAGLAGGIFGASQAAKAAKKQQTLLDKKKMEDDAWYNRNYYQNYLDVSEAKSAIKRVENTMKKRNEEAKATAAVTGGTQEAVQAQQKNDQQLMSDTVDNLAAHADARKEAVDNQKMQMDNQNFAIENQNQQAKENAGAEVMGAGLNAIKDGAAGILADQQNKKKMNLIQQALGTGNGNVLLNY